MKIAYLSTFYPFRGGISQFNASLYREFKSEHEIKSFTFKRQYPDFLFPGTSQYVNDTDKVEKIPSQAILDTINPLTYFKTAREIKRFHPDLLIMKYWMPFFAPSLGFVANSVRKNNCFVVSILDNVIPHEKRIGDIALTKYFLKRNDAFIVMSESVKKDLLSLKPNAHFILQQHPLYDHFGSKVNSAEAKDKLGLPKDKKLLLFFGFIRSYKGLDILLQALSILPEEYHLIIAGEVYGDFKEYDKIIKNLNLKNRISLFVRYINDDEVPLFFSAADVCVQPYKSATQSGIVGISFHFDLPMIATNVGGLKEMIEPYNTGIVIEKPDLELTANAVQQYFKENKKYEFVKNIKKFKSENSWKKLASSILQLYDEFH